MSMHVRSVSSFLELVSRTAFIKEQEMKSPCEYNSAYLVTHHPLIYSFLKRVVFFLWLPVVLFGYQLWKLVVFQKALLKGVHR